MQGAEGALLLLQVQGAEAEEVESADDAEVAGDVKEAAGAAADDAPNYLEQ